MANRTVFETQEDWLIAREKVFTASEANRLTAEPSKKAKDAGQVLSDGAITYIVEKISAYLGLPKFIYQNLEMTHGKDTEPEAAFKLCELLGLLPNSDEVIYTSHNGTVFFSDGILGGTPDMIFRLLKKIAEIKCPSSHTHLYNKLFLTPENFQEIYPIYYDQMQVNMYLCEVDSCIFFSYDPRFKDEKQQYHMIEIDRDEARIDHILKKAKLAHLYKLELLKKLGIYETETSENA